MAIVCRKLPNLLLKVPKFFHGGIQRVGPRLNLLPSACNLGKTFVTSKPCFKNDNDKSKSLVNKNEIKITENKEIEENDKSLITANIHECPHCHKVLSSKRNLQRHIDTVHLRLKPFKCDDCGKSFSRKDNLDQHISAVHLKLKPFTCDVCDESFAEKRTLDSHKAAKHAENLKLVKCPDCDEKFKHSKELDTHIRKFHIVTDYRCHKCNMYCSTRWNLDQHIKVCFNIRNYKCSECGAAFVEKKTLDDHMKYKHSDERNYFCDVEGCGEAFKTEANLRGHMKSHSDEKQHQCPYCEKAYKINRDLQTHVYNKHPEEYKKENDPKDEE